MAAAPRRRAATRTPRAAAEFIAFEYGKLGQPLTRMTMRPRSTVADFRSATSTEAGIQIKRQRVVLSEDTEIKEGDILMLNPKRVEGGSL